MNDLFRVIGVTFIGICAIASLIALTLVGQTCNTANSEFSAQALLKKYEWFKNTSAQLDAMKSSIKIKEGEVESLISSLPSDKNNWTRFDRENLLQSQKELSGIRMSFNNLAGQYNAQMSKENWKFCNVGELPAGATTALTREYHVYQNKE